MSVRSRLLGPTLAALLVASTLLISGSAQAASSVKLTASTKNVAIGSPVVFSYRGPARAKGYLYRSTNAGKTWKLAKTVGTHAKGKVRLNTVASGKTLYRLVYKRSGKKLGQSKNVAVQVSVPTSLGLSASTSQVDVGAGPSFAYSSAAAPAGTAITLQRQFGSAGVWQSVAPAPGAPNGAIAAPALTTIGPYTYRLAATKGAVVYAVSPTVTVFAFGTISLTSPYGWNDDSGVYQVGSTAFAYTAIIFANRYPSFRYQTVFDNSGTSCRSLTVKFGTTPGETTYVQISQASSDPVTATAQPDQVGSVTAALDGGPVTFGASSPRGYTMFLSFSASCYTLDGKR